MIGNVLQGAAVPDDQHGQPTAQRGYRPGNRRFVVGIERTGRFVEDQQAWRSQQRTGQHHALTLAA